MLAIILDIWWVEGRFFNKDAQVSKDVVSQSRWWRVSWAEILGDFELGLMFSETWM